VVTSPSGAGRRSQGWATCGDRIGLLVHYGRVSRPVSDSPPEQNHPAPAQNTIRPAWATWARDAVSPERLIRAEHVPAHQGA